MMKRALLISLLILLASCGKGDVLDPLGNGGSTSTPCGVRSMDYATLQAQLIGSFVTINGVTYRITAIDDQTGGGACRITPHLILDLNF